MPQKKRTYGITLSTEAEEAYFEFLKILNEEKLEKGVVDITYYKKELIEKLNEKGYNVSMGKINLFLNMTIKAQKSKSLFDIGNKIAIR